MKKVVIVGGVAAGASAAARLRRLDENAEIVMFEKGDYISFANCGLPYYIGGSIEDREELLVATPEFMNKRFNIDVRVNSEVVKIDAKEKKVIVNSSEKGKYEESFDYLVLAPGAKPLTPNIPGIDSEGIYTLRNVMDTDKIKAVAINVKSAVVIGGGYIGIEMAENLKEIGIDVTLVEAAPHILAPFDDDIVPVAEMAMEENGVKVILNNGVSAFKKLADGIEVELSSGDRVKGDIVIAAIGVTPDTTFLKDSGITFGPRGHIIVNEYMETGIEGVYAGGDAVEVVDFVNGTKTAIPLAGPANKQGRIIANNIAGRRDKYANTQGTTVIKVFDLALAATGNNERTLKRLNIPYNIVILHPYNHAGYYPGAQQMTLKLIFNQEGKILGAQAVGRDGAEKRIDVIAAVLRMGGTIHDLAEMELCYAPPFGSAKDAVNFAGFVAENALNGDTDLVHPRELKNLQKDGNIVVLDVRTEEERTQGSVENSIHIDVNELRDNLDKLDKNKEYWIHCAVGIRAFTAERIMKQNGFMCKNVTGGYKTIRIMEFKPKGLN